MKGYIGQGWHRTRVVEKDESTLTVCFDIFQFKYGTFPWGFLYFKIKICLQHFYAQTEIYSEN